MEIGVSVALQPSPPRSMPSLTPILRFRLITPQCRQQCRADRADFLA